MKVAVRFFSELLNKEIIKEFNDYGDAVRFAKEVNGIVVA